MLNAALREKNEELKTIISEIAQQAIKEFNEAYGLSGVEYNVIVYSISSPLGTSSAHYEESLYKQMEHYKANRQKAIDDKYNEIILQLELGGTKQDLDNMLAELCDARESE